VATLSIGLHLLLALAVFGTSLAPALAVLRAIEGPVSFLPVPSPLWLVASAVAVGLAGARLMALAQGRALRPTWSWAYVLAFAACLGGRALAPDVESAGYSSVHGAPPAIQTVEALQRIKGAILQAEAAGRAIPSDQELLSSLRVDGRELWPSYLYRGLTRRPFHLVRIPGASGAVTVRQAGDLAGTLYLAIDPDGSHFWLTAVILLEDHGRLISDMLPSGAGLAVLTNAG
jgi:hypothetical protein